MLNRCCYKGLLQVCIVTCYSTTFKGLSIFSRVTYLSHVFAFYHVHMQQGIYQLLLLNVIVASAIWRCCLAWAQPCCCLLQWPPLSSRCEDMQLLLVQLVLQLLGIKGPMATQDEGMQRLLLTGCCKCLQSVCLQSAPANHLVSLFCDTAPIIVVLCSKQACLLTPILWSS